MIDTSMLIPTTIWLKNCHPENHDYSSNAHFYPPIPCRRKIPPNQGPLVQWLLSLPNQPRFSLCQTNLNQIQPHPPPLLVLSSPYPTSKEPHDLISKLLTKKNIKTMFKPYKTLKQLFRSAKDKSDPMLGPGVYQIPCSCGKYYIGQTGRSFQACLKEHIVDTTHNRISKSTISEHSFNSKHLIFFDQTKILASTPHYSS
jgi:hypothetical protein